MRDSDICKEKRHIKYFGVLLDEQLSGKPRINFVCSRISRDTAFFFVSIPNKAKAQEPTIVFYALN